MPRTVPFAGIAVPLPRPKLSSVAVPSMEIVSVTLRAVSEMLPEESTR